MEKYIVVFKNITHQRPYKACLAYYINEIVKKYKEEELEAVTLWIDQTYLATISIKNLFEWAKNEGNGKIH